MSLRISLHPAARAEFEAAIGWYEARQPGLGRAFKLEVKLALRRAVAHPEHFRRVRGRAQTIRLRRFEKYAIYFAIKDDVLAILAIFHASRDPATLERRIK